MDSFFIRTGIFLAALAGFSIAAYIRYKKIRKQPLVCPLGSDCDAVISSSYSKILGVSVELPGIAFFFLVAVASGASLAFPEFLVGNVPGLLMIVAAAAEAFSLYLLFIQFAVLKEWCLWCVGSFAASTAVFVLLSVLYFL